MKCRKPEPINAHFENDLDDFLKKEYKDENPKNQALFGDFTNMRKLAET